MQRDHIFHAAFYFVSERHLSCRVHWTSPLQLPAACNTSCTHLSRDAAQGACRYDPQSPVRLFDTAVTLSSHKMYTRQVALGFTVQNSYRSYDLLAKLPTSFCKWSFTLRRKNKETGDWEEQSEAAVSVFNGKHVFLVIKLPLIRRPSEVIVNAASDFSGVISDCMRQLFGYNSLQYSPKIAACIRSRVLLRLLY